MEDFLTELRKAHRIVTLHERGEKNLFQLASKAKLSLAETAEWVNALHLPMKHANNQRRPAMFVNNAREA